MKTILLSGLVLVASVAAHPHRNHARKHSHPKRAVFTSISYVTTTLADVVVWVDEHGRPYQTETISAMTKIEGHPVTTSQSVSSTGASPSSSGASALPVSIIPSSSSSFSPTVTPHYGGQAPSTGSTSTSAVPTPAPPPDAMPSTFTTVRSPPAASIISANNPIPSAGKQAADGAFPLGVAWDAFFKDDADGQIKCKPTDMIAKEFDMMKSYGMVRLYGTACNQIPAVVPLALKQNQKLIFGIYSPQESIADNVKIFSDAIKSQAGGKWDMVAMVTVENERVNSHELTASAVVDLIKKTKGAMSAVGYTGPVGAVETVPAMVDNPTVCQNSDLALVNIHAFFDTNTLPEDAGKFVRSEVGRVQQACGSKRVVVLESGWPYQGDTNGQATPSRNNQKTAIDSIKAAFSQDLVLFTPFDSNWKTDSPETFNAEKYWGFMGAP